MSWRKVKLGEVLTYRKGFMKLSDDEQYKLCRVQLHRRGVVLREIVSGASIRTKKQQVCKANDFIVAEMDAKVGGYGFIPDELDGAIVSSHYYLFEVNEELLKRNYFAVLNKTEVLQIQIKAKGSTNYASVRPSDVLEWEIPLPLPDQQDAIANKVFSIQEKKELISTELNHQLTLVKELRQSYLREAMQGKLVAQDEADQPADILLESIKAEKEKLIAEKRIKKDKPLPFIKPEEIPYEIPSTWTWCRLGEIVSTVFDGPFGSHLKTADYTENGVQVIRLENIGFLKFNLEKETFISEEKYKTLTQHTIFEGDIVVSSFIADGVKTTTIPKLKYTAIAKADCFCVRCYDSWTIKKFIVYALSSQPLYDELSRFSHGMTRIRINTSQLKQLMFPLPPLAEQIRIVAKLEKLMKFCDELESNIRQGIANADLLLQTALKEALRG